MAHKYLRQDPIRTARFLLNSLSDTAMQYTQHQTDLRERTQLKMDTVKVSQKLVNCEIRIGSDLFALSALRPLVAPCNLSEYVGIIEEAKSVAWLCGFDQ